MKPLDHDDEKELGPIERDEAKEDRDEQQRDEWIDQQIDER